MAYDNVCVTGAFVGVTQGFTHLNIAVKLVGIEKEEKWEKSTRQRSS